MNQTWRVLSYQIIYFEFVEFIGDVTPKVVSIFEVTPKM
jgi:hypothetical protein